MRKPSILPENDKKLIKKINPVNEKCLNDEQMLRPLELLDLENDVILIDSETSSLMLNNNSNGEINTKGKDGKTIVQTDIDARADREKLMARQRNSIQDRLNANMNESNAKKRLVLFPLHLAMHWSLLVLFLVPGPGQKKQYRWFHLDSYNSSTSHKKYCGEVLKCLTCVSKEAYPLPVETVPHQPGGWECGHFVLMNAAMLIRFQKSLLASKRENDGFYFETALCRTLRENILPNWDKTLLQIQENAKNVIDIVENQ